MSRAEALRAEHEAAKHELTVKLVKAKAAARAYFYSQDAIARKHGYPTHCEFAHLIANGTVNAPPQVDDEELDIVGRWFNERHSVNQWALRFQFDTVHGGIPWQRMRDRYRYGGWNRDKFNRRIKALLTDLGGIL